MKENFIWIIFATKLNMIDKFFYKIFGFLDNMLAKVDEVFTFNFPKSKKIKNVKSPDNRMDFPIE